MLDPVGKAVVEPRRADMTYKAVAAVVGAIGKRLETAFALIGVGVSAIGRAAELVFQPVSAALGLVGGRKELTHKHWALTPHPGWDSLCNRGGLSATACGPVSVLMGNFM